MGVRLFARHFKCAFFVGSVTVEPLQYAHHNRKANMAHTTATGKIVLHHA